MLSEGLEIEISDFDADNVRQKDYYFGQEVEIVIGGVPTVLKIRFKCMFMSRCRILLQRAVSTNLFDRVKHDVDLRNVDVGISLFGYLNLLFDINLPGAHFMPLLAQHPSISICVLVYLLLLHELCFQGNGFGLHLVAGTPE